MLLSSLPLSAMTMLSMMTAMIFLKNNFVFLGPSNVVLLFASNARDCSLDLRLFRFKKFVRRPTMTFGSFSQKFIFFSSFRPWSFREPSFTTSNTNLAKNKSEAIQQQDLITRFYRFFTFGICSFWSVPGRTSFVLSTCYLVGAWWSCTTNGYQIIWQMNYWRIMADGPMKWRPNWNGRMNDQSIDSFAICLWAIESVPRRSRQCLGFIRGSTFMPVSQSCEHFDCLRIRAKMSEWISPFRGNKLHCTASARMSFDPIGRKENRLVSVWDWQQNLFHTKCQTKQTQNSLSFGVILGVSETELCANSSTFRSVHEFEPKLF